MAAIQVPVHVLFSNTVPALRDAVGRELAQFRDPLQAELVSDLINRRVGNFSVTDVQQLMQQREVLRLMRDSVKQWRGRVNKGQKVEVKDVLADLERF